MMQTTTVISNDRCRVMDFVVVPVVRSARSHHDAFRSGLRPDREPFPQSDRKYRYIRGYSKSFWRGTDYPYPYPRRLEGNRSWHPEASELCYSGDDGPASMSESDNGDDIEDEFHDSPPRLRRDSSRRSHRASVYRHEQRRRGPYDARPASRYAVSPAMQEPPSPAISASVPWSPFLNGMQQMSLAGSSPGMPFAFSPMTMQGQGFMGGNQMAYVAMVPISMMGGAQPMMIPRSNEGTPAGHTSHSLRESRRSSARPVNPYEVKRETTSRQRAATMASHTPLTDYDNLPDTPTRPAYSSLPEGTPLQEFGGLPLDNEFDGLFAETEEPMDSTLPRKKEKEPTKALSARRSSGNKPNVYCPQYVLDCQAPEHVRKALLNDKDARRGTKYARPTGSYTILIGKSILQASSKGDGLKVVEIFHSILEQYPYFTLDPRLLYNGIRHAVTHCVAFTKVQMPHGDISVQSRIWRVTPGYEYWFEAGHNSVAFLEARRKRTASQSSSGTEAPFEMEMDNESPEIPLISLFEQDRARATTPDQQNTAGDVERTPIGPASDRTPMARSSQERPPRLDMNATRSNSALSRMNASSSGTLTPGLSSDAGSSVGPSSSLFLDMSSMDFPVDASWSHSRGVESAATCLGFQNSTTRSAFGASSTFIQGQSSRTPFSEVSNQRSAIATPKFGFSPFMNFNSNTGSWSQPDNTGNDLVDRPLSKQGPLLHKPVPVRSLSALGMSRPGSATVATSTSTVSSLASAMDVSLIRSRTPGDKRV